MNHEFDMLETRLAMIGDVVDVFALHEANVTNDGRPKQPLFYNKFKPTGGIKCFRVWQPYFEFTH